jgi:hypothetical protein
MNAFQKPVVIDRGAGISWHNDCAIADVTMLRFVFCLLHGHRPA